MNGYTTTFIVNDTQYPFTDWGVWNTAVAIAGDLKPDRVLMAGDMLDFEMLSSYSHNPYKGDTLAVSVAGFHAEIINPLLGAVGDKCELVFVEGNHEERIHRYVVANAPALADSLDAQGLMGLEDWKYVPYQQGVGFMLASDLMVTHGWLARSHSAYTAKAMVEQVGMSVLHGHTHRVGHYAKTTPGGTKQGWEMGHMCDPRKCPGFHKGGVPDWQPVAGHVVRVCDTTNSWTVTPIQVFGRDGDRRAIWNDREYRVDAGA